MSSSSSDRLIPHPPDLIKWIKKEGGFVHPAIKIVKTGPHGYGLVASEKIPKGSILIYLPPHLPLRFDSNRGDDAAAAHSVLVNLSRNVPEEYGTMKLGLKLLQERGAKKGSFWWPYISNLPETSTVPILLSDEDIKNFHFPPIACQLSKSREFLVEFDKSARKMLEDLESDKHPFGGQDVNASSLGWAMSTVSSRAFGLNGEKLNDGNRVNVSALFPLIDMCNHSFNPNAIFQDCSGEGVFVKVERDIQRDEPLLLNYGFMNNDQFLLGFGFVVTSNPYDHTEHMFFGDVFDAAKMLLNNGASAIRAAGVSSPNISSPTPYQRRILSQLNLTGEPNLQVKLGGQDLVEGRLLAALRIIIANDDETVKKIDLDVLMSLSAEAPLGKETEKVVLGTLIYFCSMALCQFPTKLMEDKSLLKKKPLSSSMELALRYRIEKKSVIKNVMKSLEKKLNALLLDNS